MAALLAAAAAPDFPAAIVLVASNRPGAAGLARAAAAAVPTAVIDHTGYADRTGFDAALDGLLREHGVEIVCLAGFMRILTDGFVRSWEGRTLNMHPSLLPLFKGLRPHAQALAAGVRLHGCSVHFVTPELDSGPIIAQAAVPVKPGDTEEALADRVLAAEHRLYPEGLALVASGAARLEAGRTVFSKPAP